MPKKVGGEYSGDTPTRHSVSSLGPEGGRELETHEKLRLGYLTGQEVDPEADPKTGFFQGVDPDYPEFVNGVPLDYTNELRD